MRPSFGLYVEKERECQSGEVKPFVHDALSSRLRELVGSKETWEIDDATLREAEARMMEHARSKR